MLLLLLASIYITFICLVWGIMAIRLLQGINKQNPLPHLSIICLFGFSAITVLAGVLSLFIPLGRWPVQLIVLLPACLFLFSKSWKIGWGKIKKEVASLKTPAFLLLIVCTILLLVMGSWKIVHPDTLGYHAQTIQWIEKYKAVPGLVNLHTRFGYQGLWFPVSALFSFDFLETSAVTFINTAILFWYFLFISDKIIRNLSLKGNYSDGIAWILLLAISIWSYTQVRLTATSASPDFITVLMVWTVVYLFCKNHEPDKKNNSDDLLISLLCFSAITLKLSVLPVIAFPIIILLKLLWKKKIKQFIGVAAIAVITFFPFVARNIITSGYVVFPSTVLDITNVDWKYDQSATMLEKDYIKAYARIEADKTKEEIETLVNMSPGEWIPVWWQKRSVADKSILLLFILAFIMSVLKIKKILSSNNYVKTGLIVMLAGIIFWFSQAPDPRFGFGFLIGFIAIIAHLFTQDIKVSKMAVVLTLSIFIIAISAYTAYRFKNFFAKEQWLLPTGIEKISYTTVNCNGLLINRPPVDKEFGNTPVPCSNDSCTHFIPRGKKITDGFRAK